MELVVVKRLLPAHRLTVLDLDAKQNSLCENLVFLC